MTEDARRDLADKIRVVLTKGGDHYDVADAILAAFPQIAPTEDAGDIMTVDGPRAAPINSFPTQSVHLPVAPTEDVVSDRTDAMSDSEMLARLNEIKAMADLAADGTQYAEDVRWLLGLIERHRAAQKRVGKIERAANTLLDLCGDVSSDEKTVWTRAVLGLRAALAVPKESDNAKG